MQLLTVDVQLTMVAVRYFVLRSQILKAEERGHSVVAPQALLLIPTTTLVMLVSVHEHW